MDPNDSNNNKTYQKYKLDEPIVLDIEKIQGEGIHVKPNVAAEDWLSRRCSSLSSSDDEEEDDGIRFKMGVGTWLPKLEEAGLAKSCSSGSVKAVPGISQVFDGLKMNESTELVPILDDGNEQDDWTHLTPFRKLEKIFDNITDDGSLKKKLLQVGTDKKVPLHAVVWIRYDMYCDGMDEIVYQTKKPFKFRLFQPDIMPWIDLAVTTMDLYETSWFLVQPELGFKKNGLPGFVPPNSKLLFKVELVDFREVGAPGLTRLEEETLQTRSYQEIIACVVELKDRASAYLNRREPCWRSAYNLYRRAAHFLEKYFVFDPALEQDMLKNVFNLHNNMTLCATKMEWYERAVFHSEKALQTPAFAHSNLQKLYYRRATAELEMGQPETALEDILKAKQCNPTDTEIQALEKRIREKLRADNAVQKDLFKKMMAVP